MIRRSNLLTAIYVLLVFLSGAVVGAFAHRLYMPSSVSTAATPEQYRRKYVEEMRSRLKLTDEQVNHLQPILDETRRKFRDLHERSKPEMKAIQEEQVQKVRSLLTESQRAEYEKMREERERKRQQLQKTHPSC